MVWYYSFILWVYFFVFVIFELVENLNFKGEIRIFFLFYLNSIIVVLIGRGLFFFYFVFDDCIGTCILVKVGLRVGSRVDFGILVLKG